MNDKKCFGICSFESNSMLSGNPNSGIYEAETSRTLDLNGGNPACNQGGIAIVEPIPFSCNQREEVRELGNKATALQANHGMHQQTFIAEPVAFRKTAHPMNSSQGQGWEHTMTADTLNVFDNSESRTPILAVEPIGFNRERCGAVTMKNKMPTLQAAAGESGNNQPMVVQPIVYDGSSVTNPLNAQNPLPGDPCPTLGTDSRNYVVAPQPAYTLKIRGGVPIDSKGKPAGKGPLIQKELSATLGVSQDQTLFQPVHTGFSGLDCREVSNTLVANMTNAAIGTTQDNLIITQSVQENSTAGYVINSNGKDIATTLDGSYYLGQGFRGGQEREFVVMKK